MSRKQRDPIAEIVRNRRRARGGTPYALAESRAFEIVFALIALEKTQPGRDRVLVKAKREALRYFSVAMVACLQGYYRLAIADLIKAGEPFRSRIRRLEDLRLDTTTILRMQDA